MNQIIDSTTSLQPIRWLVKKLMGPLANSERFDTYQLEFSQSSTLVNISSLLLPAAPAISESLNLINIFRDRGLKFADRFVIYPARYILARTASYSFQLFFLIASHQVGGELLGRVGLAIPDQEMRAFSKVESLNPTEILLIVKLGASNPKIDPAGATDKHNFEIMQAKFGPQVRMLNLSSQSEAMDRKAIEREINTKLVNFTKSLAPGTKIKLILVESHANSLALSLSTSEEKSEDLPLYLSSLADQFDPLKPLLADRAEVFFSGCRISGACIFPDGEKVDGKKNVKIFGDKFLNGTGGIVHANNVTGGTFNHDFLLVKKLVTMPANPVLIESILALLMSIPSEQDDVKSQGGPFYGESTIYDYEVKVQK